jgi:hypothetical protein
MAEGLLLQSEDRRFLVNKDLDFKDDAKAKINERIGK